MPDEDPLAGLERRATAVYNLITGPAGIDARTGAFVARLRRIEAVMAGKLAPGALAPTATTTPEVPPAAGETTPKAAWQPPPGYVGVKTVCNDPRFQKNGKNPPRSTIDGWIDAAARRRERITKVCAPDTREVHLPEEWVHERIREWNPRPS